MKIPVFYSSKMVADSGSYSPSASKPEQVVAAWQKDFGEEIEVIPPTPLKLRDITRAHDPVFALGVLNCLRDNGFGNKSPAVAKSLPYTTGAMYDAAVAAIANRKVAAAPCSGFHHAGYESPGGFCTFNGLMIAALKLLSTGQAKRVGILDCDMHYGDGTENIIRRLDVAEVTHWTAASQYNNPGDADPFLDSLPGLLKGLFSDSDVVLYQAGADPHVNDPLGGWLETEELMERDEIVFATLQQMGVPVAWNLAGGYQKREDGSIPDVIEIHANTMAACIEVFGGN